MSDWIDSQPTACASIEGDEIVIRIPRLAIPVIASAVTRPRSVFVSDISGLREEIVAAFNKAATGNDCIGGLILGLLVHGTPNATALIFPDEAS
ncbi:MAG TPA: hypothetical protein VF499_12520 [Afipia sp.]